MTDAHSVRLRKRFTKGQNIAMNVTSESENITSEGPPNLPVIVLPFILHLGFMAATAFLIMHVQARFPPVSLLLAFVVVVLSFFGCA